MRVLGLYKDIASPWICATVYLWALELRAVISTDSEPVTAWLADCAAILLTLLFWTLIFCLPIALVAGFMERARARYLNKLAVKACLIVITALYFVRWLFTLQLYSAEHDVGLIALVIAAAGLAIWAFQRRRTRAIDLESNLPSLEDCFSFAALPIVIGAVVLIGVRVAGDAALAQKHATAVAFEPKREVRPNIILIVSDALRARSMSLYGHTRVTTPNLDRWSEAATVFLDAHSNSTRTPPSMTTILTGKLPWSHGRLTKVQPSYRSDENLLRLLRDHGYFVSAVTSNEDASINLLGLRSGLSEKETTTFEHLTLSWLRSHGVYPTPTGGRMYQGLSRFLWFLGYPGHTSFYGFAGDTLKAASDFVIRAKRPFFLIIHLHEPHDPYDVPLSFRGRYSIQSAANKRPEISSDHYGHYEAALQPAVDFYRDQYDEAIQYMDEQLAIFFREIEKQMPGRDYMLIFTGDHGESFERGFMNHGEELFESSTRVPLLIRFPKQTQGTKLPGLVQSADIAPTVLSIAGIDLPTWMEGRALHPDKTPQSEATVAVNFKDPVGQKTFDLPTKVAIWSKSHKLIVACDTGRVSLYNLAADPGESIDLSGTAPAVRKDIENSLKSVLAKQSRGPSFPCAINDRSG
jgi:arylsulfatase A-like enzyme